MAIYSNFILKLVIFGTLHCRLNTTFDHLKRFLNLAPTLEVPNCSEPFTSDADASDVEIGAVCLFKTGQRRKVAYASCIRSKAGCYYNCMAWKELLSVVAFL